MSSVILGKGVEAYHDFVVFFFDPDPTFHTMSRYVLRYAGTTTRHAESGVDTAEVVVRAGAKVIDNAPDMLLVEANARIARTLAHLLPPEWQMNAEVMTPPPAVPRPGPRAVARTRRR